MNVKLFQILIYTFVIFISACSSKNDDKNQPEETFDPEAQSSITGTITFSNYLAVDSDLNDPNSEYTDNSTFSLAQELQNTVTVQGFATKVATRTFEQEQERKRIDDRFYSTSDEYDYYKAELLAGQKISLQTIDINKAKTGSVFSGDLDLFLHSSTYEPIDYSDKLTEFDSITIQETGSYYISVHANSGASKYLLTLSLGTANPDQVTTSSQPKQSPSLDFVPNELIVQFSNQTTNYSPYPAFTAMNTSHPGRTKPTLAKFSDTYASSAATTNQAEALKELASFNPKGYESLLTLYKQKALKSLPTIESVSLNYRRYPFLIPNDTYYSDQWHYTAINLPEAWDITTGTPDTGDVIVAVIDTGIFASHPDLSNKLVNGYDFVSNPINSADNDPGTTNPNSDIDDNPEDAGLDWHGTHVAGTIGAETNNNYGVAGVSWGAKIMPIRALGTFGGTSYDLMEGLRFAAGLDNDSGTVPPKRADIINLSLGGYAPSAEEEALLSEIYDMGIIVVASAGNENSNNPSYPAAYNRVISVSALDFNSNRTAYSNYGSSIDIAAPGGDLINDYNSDGEFDGVLSTLVDGSTNPFSPVFTFYEGTSMAAPHVSGIFALMKAVYPDLNATTVDALLKNGLLTNDIGNAGKDIFYGHGSANALKAVQAAQALNTGEPIPSLPISMLSTPSLLSFSSTDHETNSSTDHETNATTLEASVNIINEGNINAQVTSIHSDRPWISTDYISGQDDGLGEYTISINLVGLLPGYYTSSLTFNISNLDTDTSDTPLVVPIFLYITDITYASKASNMQVYVRDQTTLELVRQAEATADPSMFNGQLKFTLDHIKGGNYYVYASTDVDNDTKLCKIGEACAAYPYIENIQSLHVEDSSNVHIELNTNFLNFNYSDDIINNLEEALPVQQ